MKVKSRWEILKILIKDGYTPDYHWRFTKQGETAFDGIMFNFCGKEPNSMFTWKYEWLDCGEEL